MCGHSTSKRATVATGPGCVSASATSPMYTGAAPLPVASADHKVVTAMSLLNDHTRYTVKASFAGAAMPSTSRLAPRLAHHGGTAAVHLGD